MKQGKPLQRKTPLKATKPMNRGTAPLKRSKPFQNRRPSFKPEAASTGRGRGLKASSSALSRTVPTPGTKRADNPRPPRKPLKSKPPRITPEERRTRKITEARSDGFCEKCGTAGATDKAHRISRGVGGRWEVANILDLCRNCHQYNHANPTTAYKGGWHLHSHSTPADYRVWLHNEGTFGWAYLHEDGTFTWAEEAENIA